MLHARAHASYRNLLLPGNPMTTKAGKRPTPFACPCLCSACNPHRSSYTRPHLRDVTCVHHGQHCVQVARLLDVLVHEEGLKATTRRKRTRKKARRTTRTQNKWDVVAEEGVRQAHEGRAAEQKPLGRAVAKWLLNCILSFHRCCGTQQRQARARAAELAARGLLPLPLPLTSALRFPYLDDGGWVGKASGLDLHARERAVAWHGQSAPPQPWQLAPSTTAPRLPARPTAGGTEQQCPCASAAPSPAYTCRHPIRHTDQCTDTPGAAVHNGTCVCEYASASCPF